MVDQEKAVATEYLAAVGTFTLAWTTLHQSVEEMIWFFLDLDRERGKIVTAQLGMKALIDMLTSIYASTVKDMNDHTRLKNLIKRLEATNNQRNEFMHCEWSFVRENGEIKALRSTKTSARGKLKTKSKNWSHADLMGLVKETIELSAAHIIALGILKGIKQGHIKPDQL